MDLRGRYAAKLALAGDVVLSFDYDRLNERQKHDLFIDLLEATKESEYFIVNLEGTICEKVDITEKVGKISMLIDKNYIEVIRDAGINVCCLSNNHSYDLGANVFENMRHSLDRAGILTFGGGNNLAEAVDVKIVHLHGIRIGLIGFTCRSAHAKYYANECHPGVADINENTLSVIAQAARKCDFLVVSLHWGREFYFYPDPWQLQYARKAVDYGADIVVGHHPHVLQGHEIYSGKHIFYSLGSLTISSIDTEVNKKGQQAARYRFTPTFLQKVSCIIILKVNGDLSASIEFVPTILGDSGSPVRCRSRLMFAVLMHVLSFPLKIGKLYDFYFETYGFCRTIWYRTYLLCRRIIGKQVAP